MTVRVDVQLATDDSCVLSADSIGDWVRRALAAAEHQGDGEVSVRIVAAADIRALNRAYRGKDSATNVLSFPAGEIEGLPADTPLPLGDIIICCSVVDEEAQQQGKSREDHLGHIIVDGCLHLLGFDHEDDQDAATMEGLETRILSAYGITNPYVDSVREAHSET